MILLIQGNMLVVPRPKVERAIAFAFDGSFTNL